MKGSYGKGKSATAKAGGKAVKKPTSGKMSIAKEGKSSKMPKAR